MRRIGVGQLTNDFYRSCGDKEKNETIFQLLCTFPAFGRRRKRHLDAYQMEHLDLDELSCIDIGSLNSSSEALSGSWNRGECETLVSQWALCAV